MMVLRATSLEKRGIPYRTAKRIQVRGRTFQKAESFSKRVYAVALAQCEQQQVEGTLCLLVETEDILTIWREVSITEPTSTSQMDQAFFNRSPRPEKTNYASIKKTAGPRFSDWILGA
jgi:predicted methyltransferase